METKQQKERYRVKHKILAEDENLSQVLAGESAARPVDASEDMGVRVVLKSPTSELQGEGSALGLGAYL